ncbi:MAG: hypothetical protein HC892_06120 [Saprospiraceae bacterium]|nr:hypothetical protein [Saprospiraceae bacterium]
MTPAVILWIFVVLGAGLAFTSFSILKKVFLNFNPAESAIQEDIRKMRLAVEPYLNKLVPIDKKELELFSLNQVQQMLKKSITTTASGIFTSIYQEPLLAYSYKKYVGKGKALLFARTAEHEFVFNIGKKNTVVAINKMYYGTIIDHKLYRDEKGKQLLGMVSESGNNMLPILVGNRQVAALLDPEVVKSPQPRAFQFVAASLDDEEEKAFLTLAILEMVQRMVD